MKLQETIKRYYELSAALKETIKKDLKIEFDEFFAKSGVKAVQWTQYSSWFNDGEECTFSVHETSYCFVDIDDLEESLDGEYGLVKDESGVVFAVVGDIPSALNESSCQYHKDNYDEFVIGVGADKAAHIINFESVLSSIPEDVMQDIYGNHVIVTVTATGTQIDEYEHD